MSGGLERMSSQIRVLPPGVAGVAGSCMRRILQGIAFFHGELDPVEARGYQRTMTQRPNTYGAMQGPEILDSGKDYEIVTLT